MSNSNHHPENPHLAGTPAGGSSAYPSELVPHNRLWHADSLPYPGAGFPATANPDYVYGPRFSAPGDTTYRADPTPLYPWRVHSDALKTMIRNLMLQINSEVVEVRRETHEIARG